MPGDPHAECVVGEPAVLGADRPTVEHRRHDTGLLVERGQLQLDVEVVDREACCVACMSSTATHFDAEPAEQRSGGR